MLHEFFGPFARLSRRRIASFGAAAAIALAACRDLQSLRTPPPTPPSSTDRPVQSQLVPPTAAPLPKDPIETIVRLEDERSDGDGLLQVLLAKGDEATRERAAVALGRLPYPDQRAAVTDALASAMRDSSKKVRAAAAFAIGIRGDPAGANALLEKWIDPSAEVRARVVEAASRLDDARLRAKTLEALRDPESSVRIEAALAPHRWPASATEPKAAEVDAALLAVVRQPAAQRSAGEARNLASQAEHEVAWRALFTLARRKSEAARGAFEEALAHGDTRERIYASQGLGAIGPQPSSQALLRQALNDGDWRVVCEAAAAIGKHPDVDDLGALAPHLESPSPHVRRVICETLGKSTENKEAVAESLERGMRDASANVRAAALVARATLFRQDKTGESAVVGLDDVIGTVWKDVELASKDADPIARAGAAEAAVHMAPDSAVPLLIRMTGDKDLRVAGTAVESLGKLGAPEARKKLRALLAHKDNGIRLAAVLALRESHVADDLPFLQQCYVTSRGEIADEIAFNVLESAAKTPEAEELLKQGFSHENAYVRRKTRQLWIASGRDPAQIAAPVRPASKSANGKVEPPSFAASARPRVEIRTTRGSMVFELFPAEAPHHVASFLGLARSDRYDGLLFHRVVPDFVIQGGDPRGDGNGGSAFGGGSLRAEFTPRKYVRGSLGMPRNDDPDSGGGQIFVTHRETPHLDGRYTLFGQLVEGFDVLDKIEVGDTILDVIEHRTGS